MMNSKNVDAIINNGMQKSKLHLSKKADNCHWQEDLLYLPLLSGVLLLKPHYLNDAPLRKSFLTDFHAVQKDKAVLGLERFPVETYAEVSEAITRYKQTKDVVEFEYDLIILQKKNKEKKYLVNVLQAVKNLGREVVLPHHGRIQESKLTCSYVHPVLSGLFMFENVEPFNANVKENNDNQRPDYRNDHFNQTGTPLFSAFYGEIKAKYAVREATHSIYKDTYRLACFSKNAIKTSKINAVMSAQVVDSSFFFYLTCLEGKKLYAMTEFASFVLPFTLASFDLSLELLNQLGYIVQVYQNHCLQKKDDEDEDEEVHSPTLPLDCVEELMSDSIEIEKTVIETYLRFLRCCINLKEAAGDYRKSLCFPNAAISLKLKESQHGQSQLEKEQKSISEAALAFCRHTSKYHIPWAVVYYAEKTDENEAESGFKATFGFSYVHPLKKKKNVADVALSFRFIAAQIRSLVVFLGDTQLASRQTNSIIFAKTSMNKQGKHQDAISESAEARNEMSEFDRSALMTWRLTSECHIREYRSTGINGLTYTRQNFHE
ncbi:hypothetical protein EDC96DRAFT_589150 [Choanephora cucurbitarum]|nr:hypothetical protein EDC96DRAFT_589150 [Choanephora cucurbitarum]